MSQNKNIEKNPILDVTNTLLTHPRFDLAALYYFENVSKWKHDVGFVNKFISGNTRLVILYYICFLHFRNETALPENGATFAQIWQHVESRKLMGSRALRTILGIITRAGYLQRQQGQNDKRIYALVPTNILLDSMTIHVANTMKCFDIIFQEATYAAKAAADPNFLNHSVLAICNAVKKNKAIFSDVDPLLKEIVMTSGGIETLYAIGVADLKSEPLPQPKVIAKYTTSSSSQIRSVLARLVEAGALDMKLLANEKQQSQSTKLIKIFLARELALYAKFVFQLDEKLSGGLQT